MKKRVIKSGNSLAVTIPARVVKDINIKPGDAVTILVDRSENTVTYKFTGDKQLSLGSTLNSKL